MVNAEMLESRYLIGIKNTFRVCYALTTHFFYKILRFFDVFFSLSTNFININIIF